MDGQPFVSKLDGTAISLDPGEHHFVFEADGLKSEQRTMVVREGDKNRHERVVLVGAARAPGATPAPQVPEGVAPQAPSDGHTQRIAGLALGGAGVVGLVVGTVFGFVSKSTWDKTNGHCGGYAHSSDPNSCDGTGFGYGQTAHSQATVATVAFIVGPALLAGGAYLYFTAPRAEVAVAPTVGGGGASLSLRGRW
jgi:serine/threonine-protein kinase